MRREWIEMCAVIMYAHSYRGLPPCGGSGLKFFNKAICTSGAKSPSMRREWIEIDQGRMAIHRIGESPSMRREWIEISCSFWRASRAAVSLHAEGVD